MSYQLAVHPQPGYLHIIVTGENSRQNVTRYMEELVRECTLRQCFRVLVEERLEGARLGTLDVFEMVSTGSTRFLRTLTAAEDGADVVDQLGKPSHAVQHSTAVGAAIAAVDETEVRLAAAHRPKHSSRIVDYHGLLPKGIIQP